MYRFKNLCYPIQRISRFPLPILVYNNRNMSYITNVVDMQRAFIFPLGMATSITIILMLNEFNNNVKEIKNDLKKELHKNTDIDKK